MAMRHLLAQNSYAVLWNSDVLALSLIKVAAVNTHKFCHKCPAKGQTLHVFCEADTFLTYV